MNSKHTTKMPISESVTASPTPSLSSLLIPFFLVLLISVTSVATLVYVASDRINTEMIATSISQTDNALHNTARSLGYTVRDYGYWTEAVDHLVVTLDTAWAGENIGAYLVESFEIDAVFVIGGDDKIQYAAEAGVPVTPPLLSAFSSGITEQLQQARAVAEPVPTPLTGLLSIEGKPYLVALTALTTTEMTDKDRALVQGQHAVLLFAKQLDQELLDTLADTYQLTDLHWLSPGAPPTLAELPLHTVSGLALGRLAWTPTLPGEVLIRQVMPPILLVFIGIGAASLVFVRRLLQAMQALRHSEQTVRQLNTELEQRVAERTTALYAAQAELVRQERLATLGQLTATVSHELRNPMGAIRNAIITIRRLNHDLHPILLNSIDIADRCVGRCDNIISDLLDFSRIRPPERQPTALDAWLQTVLAEYAFPPDVQVEQSLAADVTVAVDQDRLRRALINVFDNGCQALHRPDKCLSVATQHDPAAAQVAIIVSDNGSGITPEDMAHIFEPLYSTKSYGIGLGLPTVQQIMQQHGGGIEINSTPGQGTRVRLWLPV